MVNFVDFDTNFGHRRDPFGYGKALEEFDAEVPRLQGKLKPSDLIVFTADHGNDPTWKGTDHTREGVPILCWGVGLESGPIGRRETFADIGQTLARHLGIPPLAAGTAWLL
jgi:phosphopentomutase